MGQGELTALEDDAEGGPSGRHPGPVDKPVGSCQRVIVTLDSVFRHSGFSSFVTLDSLRGEESQ